MTEDNNAIDESHRKEESDRVKKERECAFLNTHKHHIEDSLGKDDNDSCQMPNLRSAATANYIPKQRGCSNFPDRLLVQCPLESETQERSSKGSEHSDHSLHSYEENKNLLSHSKLYNSQNTDKKESSFQTKNGLKNYLCVSTCKIDRCDQEVINGVNRLADSSPNRTEESVNVPNHFFNEKKVSKTNQRDSMSLDPNCRKSPVHGKAPKNSTYPGETKQSDDFHSMNNTLEGLSMETFKEELAKYEQEKNSMEPSVAEGFDEIKRIEDGSDNRSFRNYNKLIADQNDVQKAKLHRTSETESAAGVVENSEQAAVKQTDVSESVDTKESEDTRNLTLKRSLSKRSEFFESALRPRKEQKTKSSRKSMKSRNKKSRTRLISGTALAANNKKLSSVTNPSGRLTRSQKKDIEKVTTVTAVGATDDDSGIQGDIYEFNEKDSNLESISLSSVMRHKFERRSPNPETLLHENRCLEEVKPEPSLFSQDGWTPNDPQNRSHEGPEEKPNG